MIIKSVMMLCVLASLIRYMHTTPAIVPYDRHIGSFTISGHIIKGRTMQDTVTEINPVTLGETMTIRRYAARTGRWDYYDGITYCAYRDYGSDTMPAQFFEPIPDSIFWYADVDTSYTVYDTIRPLYTPVGR